MLSNKLKPQQVRDMMRIGSLHDGGYLVSKKDILASENLVSLGINDDWNFEEQFLTIKKVKLSAYDGSVGLRFWIEYIYLSIIRRPLFLSPIRAVIKFLKFKSFFRKHELNLNMVAFGRKSLNLSTILDGKEKVFLKIDIEGSEYRLLDDVLANASNITGLIIEFHDVDLNLCKVEDFIARFPLKLIHVHANTSCPVSESGTPFVLEMSFSNSATEFLEHLLLPHPLDRPSKKGETEIELNFND